MKSTKNYEINKQVESWQTKKNPCDRGSSQNSEKEIQIRLDILT